MMKKLFSLLLVVALIGVATASAQTAKSLSATPKAFQLFYAKFRKAVVARDRNAVVALTRFPFKYGYDAGDEGTYSRAQFLKNFNHVIGSRRPIFLQRNPKFYSDSDGFDLTDESDATHFIFEKKGASYKFVAYIAEP